MVGLRQCRPVKPAPVSRPTRAAHPLALLPIAHSLACTPPRPLSRTGQTTSPRARVRKSARGRGETCGGGQGGSLHSALYDERRPVLTVAQRLGIALDVARGLAYLHERRIDDRRAVVHRSPARPTCVCVCVCVTAVAAPSSTGP